MNVTEEKERVIKSQRARELDELRSKGVAKSRKLKLNELMSSPLTTPEQAKMFLAAMRDKGRRESVDSHMAPPSHLTADGIDAWYMMQSKREKELKMRRREAESLLRGYRGPYFADDMGFAMSPRHGRTGRSSFGAFSDALSDPATAEKRRQSTMPRLEHNWGESYDATPGDRSQRGNRLGPDRTAFLDERQHYDGTRYGKIDDRSAYDSGRALFGEYEGRHSERREPGSHQHTRARSFDLRELREDPEMIDTTHSESRLRDAFGETGTLSLDGGFGRTGASNMDGVSGTPSYQMPVNLDGRLREAVKSSKPRYSMESGITDASSQVEPVELNPAPVPETIWRDFISSEPGAKFPPEAGRYHLYASYACPGSHRALIVRTLKGLEDVVSVTIVHPTWRHTNLDSPGDKHRGWVFGDPNGQPFQNTTGRGGPFPAAYPGNEPDPVLDAYSVRELYEFAEDTSGKYTIPLLWDKKLNTIVNNESSDISYMLNSCFDEFSSEPDLDLYTEDDDEGMDKLNEVSQWLYPMMIHGVYRCGFAKTQKAYDHAIDELTAAFDMADELLQNQRYLTGDILTDADIRLFVTLLRFDEVYAFYFRANTRLVMLTPALLNFCREIYQMKGIAETCHMDQIKAHFFGSHAEWNKYSVIPRGLGFMDKLKEPHDRDQFSSSQS
eukprot:Nitzschia sp. Nitz4//scaffold46_size129759//53988//56150//NITZ4_003500-RA/size129759-augustus-gene-0.7-mRNA-1//1//CDS//3329552592//2420//frame0